MATLYIGDIRPLLGNLPVGILTRKLESPESFRVLVAEFSGLATCPRLLLYDLADLGAYAAVMLKFIDTYQGQLVCLSSKDTVDSAMASRFSRVEKHPDMVTTSEEPDPATLVDFLGEERDLTRAIAEYCPPFLRVYEYSRGLPARDTLLALFL